MGLGYSSNRNIYDWKPELPDFRDNIYKYPRISSRLSHTVDLRKLFKEYTQEFGSSAATSVASILDSYDLRYNFDNSDIENIGSIRNCIKKFKIIDENKVEHGVELENDEVETLEIYEKKLRYTKLCNFKNQLRQSLHERYPIIFGFTVYESFESEEVKKTGIIKNPEKGEKILGGLCAVIVGYNSEKNWWIVKHPLGKDFGDNGYVYISCEILAKNNNLTSDFWRISYY